MASKKPLLLDGGMGQEIVNRGGKDGYGQWATAALIESPRDGAANPLRLY